MTRRTFLHLAVNLTLSGVACCCCLLGIELAGRIYNYLVPPPPDLFEFRLSQPPPYKDAPYFSREFLEESFRQPAGWHFPEGTRLVIPKDFNGKYFHVVDGYRVTRYQPDHPANTVHVFGGSTIYCSEVPDEYTVTSRLQLLFNEAYGRRYRVRNYGATTVTSTQQLERLETADLQTGDIVVFYDGVNDILQGLYYANPEETMVERNRRVIRELSPLERWLVRSSEFSVAVKRWLSVIDNRRLPPHLEDERQLNSLLGSLEARYRMNIAAARDHAEQKGARFFHFLQPNIYTRKVRSSYEERVVSNYNLFAWAGVSLAFHRGYPILRSVSKDLSEGHGVRSYDLTRILEERGRGEEYYLDTCHVAHGANRIVARNIFERVRAEPTGKGR